jgi:hypothetical protein
MTFDIYGMEYKRPDESDMRMATSQRLQRHSAPCITVLTLFVGVKAVSVSMC